MEHYHITYGDAYEGFLNRLKDWCPQLLHRKANLMDSFSEKDEAARMRVWSLLLRLPLEYPKRVFFIGYKALYCRPKGGYISLHQDDRGKLTMSDRRL